MRPNVSAFVEIATGCFGLRGPVYEFGSYQVQGQHDLADLRRLFPGQDYIGCDLRPGPGVDLVADMSSLPLNDSVARTAICVDTLEHVFEVSAAVREITRVLAPGGALLVSAPMDFRVHAYPDDYWRLTPSCLARLLSPLDAMVLGSQGVENHPHTVFAIAWKAPLSPSLGTTANRFIEIYQSWLQAAARRAAGRRRVKNWLRRWFASKGERRRIQEMHHSRFAVQLPIEAAQFSAPAHNHWPSATAGSRFDLQID